jgi:hypothetical protein
MARQVITKQKLKAWLTIEIQKFEGCEHCQVGGISNLRVLDEGGCNWSDSVVLRATGVPAEIYRSAFTQVMVEARAKFNVS